MRAHVLDGAVPAEAGPLRLEEREECEVADLAAGQVVVDVLACAVCRTDLQICEGDLAARRLPIVPGHQAVGDVHRVGADVVGIAVGDRVGVTWLAGTCGACRFCASGRENLCVSARFTGWDVDGGFATSLVADHRYVQLLDPALDPVRAAPLLCGGVIGYRALRVAGVEPGQRLGLYGFGASATAVIQVAVHWGCEVAVVTRSPAEQRRARALGASWTGGYDSTPPFLLDAAITFAPVGDVVVHALQALDRGGTVAINAIHLDRVPELSFDWLWWERSVRSVANVTRADARELLDLAAAIPIVAQATAYPFDAANSALADLRHGRVAGAAVLVVE